MKCGPKRHWEADFKYLSLKEKVKACQTSCKEGIPADAPSEAQHGKNEGGKFLRSANRCIGKAQPLDPKGH